MPKKICAFNLIALLLFMIIQLILIEILKWKYSVNNCRRFEISYEIQGTQHVDGFCDVLRKLRESEKIWLRQIAMWI